MVSVGSTLRGHVRCLNRLRLRSSWRDDFAPPAALPELQRYWNRINVESLPPCGFVSGAMQLAVMEPADWHSKLVAHSASEGTRPHTRHASRSTNLRWSLSRRRTVLPKGWTELLTARFRSLAAAF